MFEPSVSTVHPSMYHFIHGFQCHLHIIQSHQWFVFSLFLNKFIYFNWRLITLQYCIRFAIYQHESTTGVHVFPILNLPPTPSPYHPSGSSQCISPSILYNASNLDWRFISYMILCMFFKLSFLPLEWNFYENTGFVLFIAISSLLRKIYASCWMITWINE